MLLVIWEVLEAVCPAYRAACADLMGVIGRVGGRP